MSKPIQLSDHRGLPLLKFIWTWKLVSTAALARQFFPKTTHPYSSYNWLLRLKREGYLAQRWDDQGKGFLWTLDRAGFAVVKNHLPPLREEGFRAEHAEHDWLASAFHLGAWLLQRPDGVFDFSEQQLRRYEVEDYPTWVPKTLSHRPDGYWHRSSNDVSRTVALEMELSRKKAPVYQSIGNFYGEAAQVNRVLWVVHGHSDAARILENLKKAPGARPNDIHSFVRLDSFRKLGWSAPIEYGPGRDLTTQSFLCKALGISENDFRVTSQCRVTAMSLLETRVRQSISVPSGTRREGSVLRLTTTSVVATPAPHETRLNVQPEVSQ